MTLQNKTMTLEKKEWLYNTTALFEAHIICAW